MIVLQIERMLAAEFRHLTPLWMGLLLLVEISVLGWLLVDGFRTLLHSVAGLLARRKQAERSTKPVEGVWPPAPKPPDAP